MSEEVARQRTGADIAGHWHGVQLLGIGNIVCSLVDLAAEPVRLGSMRVKYPVRLEAVGCVSRTCHQQGEEEVALRVAPWIILQTRSRGHIASQTKQIAQCLAIHDTEKDIPVLCGSLNLRPGVSGERAARYPLPAFRVARHVIPRKIAQMHAPGLVIFRRKQRFRGRI